MSRQVAIIGAGYAGMACAVELTRAGHQVTVFERSHILGGRARLVSRDEWGIDNGQHILIGAYSELLRLLRLTGMSAKALLALPLTLHVPGRLHLQAKSLPAPLHLAAGIMLAKGLNWQDRLAMIRLIRHLKREHYRLPPDMTVRMLLHRTGQTATVQSLIWEPLCVAALNTPVDVASSQVFANVLRDSLGSHASASELLIPKLDLSELFPVQAARYLATRRGKLRTGTAINGIEIVAGRFRLAGDPDRHQTYDDAVIATAPYHAGSLLDSTGQCERLARQIDALPHEPITTLYFAFGPSVRLPHPMIGCSDGPAQWAFDRGQLGGPAGLIALVISTRSDYEQLTRDDLEIAVLQQLERQLGKRLPPPVWARTITEKRATIACHTSILRPGIRTPVANLWLAGDYIDSPYPATLESAVRSGTAVAAAIDRQHNQQTG